MPSFLPTALLQAPSVTRFQETLYPAIQASLEHFGAEFCVGILALCILLIDLILPLKASRHLAWLALLACLFPLTYVDHVAGSGESIFLGMMASDSFSVFFKYFFLLGSVPVVLLSFVAEALRGRRMGEYYFTLLSAVLGGMLMASATHFLMLFMALELISICSYILVGYFRSDRRSAEASLKYIIYGSVAAALMAYGFSLWFGMTGSGEIRALAGVLWNPESEVYTPVALQGRAAFTVIASILLIFLGFAYKMSTVPMHFWAPDVYEGAPTPVTAFLSVLSKGAGFAITLRFFQSLAASTGFLPAGDARTLWGSVDWRLILIIISIATMTLGNLAALWQTNLKRLMAYSSIAHAGYMMMGLTLLGRPAEYGGISIIVFYLLAYLAMNFGIFAIVILIENKTGSVDIDGCRGLGWRAPLPAAALTVFLFSLIGVPPTAGFTGKFQLFMGVLDVGRLPEGGLPYYLLAVAAAANTAVSAYYYLRIVKAMYLDRGGEVGRLSFPALGHLVVVAMLVMTFYLFLHADVLLNTTLHLTMHV